MTKTETRVGLTNIIKRFAYYCVLRHGLGRHKIKDLPPYDEVEIKELYPWMPNPEDPKEYGGGVSVALYKNGEKVRFVEFAVRFAGGGGYDVIKSVK